MKIEQQALLAISCGKIYNKPGYSIDERFVTKLENAKEQSPEGVQAK